MLHFLGWLFVVLPLVLICQRITNMSEALDRLTAEVTESRTAVESAVALIAGLAQQIRDNIDDSAALAALADDLDAQQHTLGDAVAANTPAAPEAPAE